ncbi:MAG: glycosyltransferase family 39 protein [Elusimicrobia bacterium]|nr:glycosyltransferase family 39 protein [Elusimicrobiota bacterium]
MKLKVPPLVWIFLLPIVLGAPFVGRAYFVDDHYHMLMAIGTLDHPLRPYDFKADDDGVDHAGWERGQPPRMVNPPLHHYLLGLFWKLGGGRLWVVRLLCLLLSGGAAVFIYRLAARLNFPPVPVTVLSVLTPAFWLTSYALMIDATLLFFFLGALWAWVEGLRRRSTGWLIVSGLAMGLTLLTKYTGAMLLPVAALYWWTDRESGRRWTPWLTFLLPLAIFALWSGWNVATYGAVHLTESSKRVMQTFTWGHVLIFLTFLSGVFLLPLVGWVEVGNRRKTLLAILAALLLAFFLEGPRGGFSRFESLTLAALSVGGALFLWAVIKVLRGVRHPSDFFLFGWLAIGTVQMVYVMQWVAARYYLTLLVPVVFLSYRLWQERFSFSPVRLTRRWGGAAVTLFLFSLGLGAGDYFQAETSRLIARDATRDGLLSTGRRGFFLGDSFTSSYLKTVGWRPAFKDTHMVPGDLVLQQEVIMPPWWYRAETHRRRPLAVYEYTSRWPLRVMDNKGSAGFYASAWGALPFTFTRGPLERYTLYEILPETPR